MKRKKGLLFSASFLFTLLLLIAFTLPVGAASNTHHQAHANALNVRVYLTTPTLQNLFQSKINQLVPTQFNQAISSQTQQLPPDSRDLASQLAGELIQPSATLTQLTPQQSGLATTIDLGLFPGDTAPTNFSMLVTFNVQNASTIQVGAQALNGSPSLVNGNLTTLNVPLGQLNSINTTPGCGNAALMTNLSITPGQGQPNAGTGAGQATPISIEIPGSVIRGIGNGIGPMQLGPGLSAQNIQVSMQGNSLVATSNIVLGPAQVGTTTTFVQLSAVNGRLVALVTRTLLNVAVFSFPVDAFNQQIAQMVNTQLNGMIGGALNVTGVSFGPTNAIPCAAADSLLLSGTTTNFG